MFILDLICLSDKTSDIVMRTDRFINRRLDQVVFHENFLNRCLVSEQEIPRTFWSVSVSPSIISSKVLTNADHISILVKKRWKGVHAVSRDVFDHPRKGGHAPELWTWDL